MRKIILDLKKGPRHWYNEVVQAKMTPWDIALGFSIGLFFGMMALPIINFLLALLTIAILRVNKLAVMLGYFITVWPVSPFVYYGSLKLGFLLLGDGGVTPSVKEISFEVIKRYGITFAVGNVLLASLSAIALFIVIYGVANFIQIIKKQNPPPNDKAI